MPNQTVMKHKGFSLDPNPCDTEAPVTLVRPNIS